MLCVCVNVYVYVYVCHHNIVWGSWVPACPVYLWCKACGILMFDMLYFAAFTNFMCCIMCLRMRCFFASSLESVPLSDSPTWVNWITGPKTLEHSQILIVFCTSCATTPVIWGTRNHGRRRSTSNDGAAAVRPSSTGCADGKRFWALKSAHYRLEYLWIKGKLSKIKHKKTRDGKPKATISHWISPQRFCSTLARILPNRNADIRQGRWAVSPFRQGHGERLCDGESTTTLECSCRMPHGPFFDGQSTYRGDFHQCQVIL